MAPSTTHDAGRTAALAAVPAPRGPGERRRGERGPGTSVRAEVRPAALVSGDVPRIRRGEQHELGLALDDFALVEERDATVGHGIEEQEHGVDVRGTLVAATVGAHGLPVLEVLGVPVLLLGHDALPRVGARVLASGFLSVERRLWAGAPQGLRLWSVARVRREALTGLTPSGFTVTSTELDRLPAAADVDVRHQYVLDLHGG